VLDFANLVRSHGPIDQITCDTVTKAPKAADGEDKAKACPACKSLVALGIMVCPDCGHAWPVKKQAPKHEATADGVMTILSNDAAGGWVEVFRMTHHIHRKRFEPGTPPSLCIDYHCGLLSYQEYLAFEAPSDGARFYAGKKWRELGGRAPTPETVSEAVIRCTELHKPSHIRVQRNGKFTNVVQRRFLQQAVG
jgi:DNA repair protein RadD